MIVEKWFCGKGVVTALVVLGSLSAMGATPSKPQETVASKGEATGVGAGVQGQARTMLPDGRFLLTGGASQGGFESGVRTQSRDAKAPTVLGTLLRPRAFHTATLLPNAKVLIFGGVGLDGKTVSISEIFDPAKKTSTAVSLGDLIPRSHHTATVLTDGRVLIAGGVDDTGAVVDKIQMWNYMTGTSTTLAQSLKTPRTEQMARLLPDGTVFLWGGKDSNGSPLDYGEIIDPAASSSRFASKAEQVQSNDPPRLAGSIPQNGESGVPTDQLIGLRFSQPMDVTTLNAQTVTLRSSQGQVTVDVVPADEGMLAFVTTDTPLEAGSTYTVSVSGAMDQSGQQLPDTTILFTTGTSTDSLNGAGSPGSSGSGSNPWAGAGTIGSNPSGLNSEWRKLPMLPGPSGVTSLAGQVLKLDGTPLANVLVEIGPHHASTDQTGRFVVSDVGVGHHMMFVDGAPASSGAATYGIYRVGIDLKAGATNWLKYTVWMPALDTQHVVRIPSPTTSDMVITNPNVPGVELHIPAGTVIRDARGKLVTQIGITPIPTNQAPFPLKRGVTFPVYFTIQPAGASFVTPGNRNSPKAPRPRGAQIYYQNRYNAKPGTAFTFWNYDPTQRGWFIYGLGHVSSDAKMIIPDANTQIYSFDGAMVALPTNGPPDGGNPTNPRDGEPVDLQTGLFEYSKTDLVLNDVIPLKLTINYRQSDFTSRAFGIGANMDYDMFLTGDAGDTPEGYTYQDLYFGDGSHVHFERTSPCNGANGYCDYSNAVYTATSTPGPYYGATIQWTGTGFQLTTKQGTVMYFPDANDSTVWQQAAVASMHDRHGNTVTFARDGNSNLTQITSPNGKWIQFTYDSSNRVVQAQDNIGRTTSYTYNSAGYLETATDANNGVTRYTYDASGNMLTITDPRGIEYLQNEYDLNDMVTRQTLANGGTYQFQYVLDSNGNVTDTVVTDPRNYVREVTFNADGYSTSDVHARSRPETQTVTYNRQQGTGLILGVTDSLNRTTLFSYDAMADVTSVTKLAYTPNAVTTSLSYTSQYSELASLTDPLGNTTSAQYDASGNMTSAVDPLGNTTTLTYNSAGQPLSVTDPLGNETQLAYQNGSLTSITDPLGRIVSGFIDGAGRIAALTYPMNQTIRVTYNPFGEIASIVDPLGNQTTLDYDGNGNLTDVIDPNQHKTRYTYDNMDLVGSRQDPLGNSDSSQYDLNNNLMQYTDRKGQVTAIKYDGINRPTFVGYGTQSGPTYQSSTSYTFDGGNRLTTVSDSITGAISRSYDGLDHLLSETSSLGSVAYTYDADERRQTMTVSGQSQIAYLFNADSRVTSITQGASVVSFNYDADRRRTSMLLPNGVIGVYSYDTASQLTGIVYQGGSLAPSNLAYGYDPDGRRVTVSGSLATTQLPAAIASAVYNANNQLTQWGATAITYDLNGNTLNDGTNAYTWDARNHLISANSNGASFVYDGLGRRYGKTILSTNTNFLYDGLNPIQELSGTAPTANLLTGGLDERFARTDSTGTSAYLTDALGSTIGLTSSTGASQVEYSYDPYGTMSINGVTTNTYGYTGREFDGLGINYYRARYYNPTTARFISEDPVGFRGGINLYAYVGNDPTDFNDPSGRLPFGAVVGAVNGAVFGGLGAIEGDDWDWQDVVLGAGLGAAGGFATGLLDPTEGALSSGPISAGADWAGQWVHKMRHGQPTSLRCYNWGEVAGAGIGGGLGGGLGVYLEGLGAEAGLSGNALAFAESVLGGNIGLVTTPLGAAAGNAMSGHKCGCE